jgi:hypothetical protein
MTNKHHIHSGTFWDRFGITAQQCMHDISWLMGVLSTTIDDPDTIPELNSAKGDSVIALADLISVYSNNGETEQDTRWNVRDEINKTYDPSVISLVDFICNFQTNILKHQSYYPAYGRNDVLDQLKKNIINELPMLDYHFDMVAQRPTTPWVKEIQYLLTKVPKNQRTKLVSGPGRNQMNKGIFPAHLNAVATDHSTGLHKVTSIDELKDLVAKTYHMFRDKFAEEAHEHPSYQAYRSVYAVFKHDPSRLNLSIPTALWMKLDENIKKQIVRIRQEIRESKELKEKSTEKTIIGKQYPSLAKSEQDV